MKKSGKIIETIVGSEEEYKRRLKEIYGSGDHDALARKYVEENKRKFAVFMGLFCLIFIVVLLGNGGYGDALIYDKNQNIRSIKSSGIQGQTIELQAYVKGYEELGVQNVSLYINTKGNEKKTLKADEEKVAQESIKSKLLMAGRDAVDKKSGETIDLPKKLEGYGEIIWSEKQSNDMYLIITAFVLLLLFMMRDNRERFNKERRKSELSVEENLPYFISKLILLLEAGALFTSAVYKINDKHKIELRKEKDYFTLQLNKICEASREQKVPLQREILDFAIRTRKKEFIRVAGIIYDNRAKGTDLVEKLKVENTVLWNEKKRLVEEKGMLAESKMVMPLALLLTVLVVITVAPAMLTM